MGQSGGAAKDPVLAGESKRPLPDFGLQSGTHRIIYWGGEENFVLRIYISSF